jgi:sulfite exporter TauE/SafE
MTTLLIAALTLGFAGSMHCIGMCGPLVMIVHGGGKTRDSKWWFQKALYHLGRISVYAAFGIVAGLIGKSFAALGFQQWLALISGALLLLMILWPYLPFKKLGAGNKVFAAVSKRFNYFLQNIQG